MFGAFQRLTLYLFSQSNYQKQIVFFKIPDTQRFQSFQKKSPVTETFKLTTIHHCLTTFTNLVLFCELLIRNK